MKEMNVKITIVYDNKSFFDDETIQTLIKSVIDTSLFKFTSNNYINIHKIDVINDKE